MKKCARDFIKSSENLINNKQSITYEEKHLNEFGLWKRVNPDMIKKMLNQRGKEKYKKTGQKYRT